MNAPEIISPTDGAHYFFGYYDLQPLDAGERLHLCHRVGFMERLPLADDVCELGAIDLETGGFIKYAETTAWNFQQGAQLRWYADDVIAYNVRTAGGFAAELRNVRTGAVSALDRPFGDISKDGKHALSVNFSRIYDFRPGYGYAGSPDPFASVEAPEDDGVFLTDIQSGKSRLIISYSRMRDELSAFGKIVVNHITFSPSGDKFLFLLRNFPEEGKRWGTMLVVSDLDGNMRALSGYCIQSHYHWKNDREILIFGDAGGGKENCALYVYDAVTGDCAPLPGDNIKKDIHCIWSPDRRAVIGDGYRNRATGERTVYLLDENGRTVPLLSVMSIRPDCVDIRCDLHVRWSRSGSFITFDSTHTGERTICKYKL